MYCWALSETECLAFALENPDAASYGIWGPVTKPAPEAARTVAVRETGEGPRRLREKC
jgi:hypothetical protein